MCSFHRPTDGRKRRFQSRAIGQTRMFTHSRHARSVSGSSSMSGLLYLQCCNHTFWTEARYLTKSKLTHVCVCSQMVGEYVRYSIVGSVASFACSLDACQSGTHGGFALNDKSSLSCLCFLDRTEVQHFTPSISRPPSIPHERKQYGKQRQHSENKRISTRMMSESERGQLLRRRRGNFLSHRLG